MKQILLSDKTTKITKTDDYIYIRQKMGILIHRREIIC